jgi:iron complex transport system substrate-binding protein
MRNLKIVSLLPSATEIIYALGAGDLLVGRSHECDFPVQTSILPVCTRARIDASASSAAIDAAVKDTLDRALSLYEIDRELLRDLAPDLVITQDQCQVCAVNLEDVQASLNGLLEKDAEIISLHPRSLEDILEDIRTIALALDVIERGEQLIEELTDRYELVEHKVKLVKSRPEVLCIEWMDPLMAAGNWTPEHSPWISWEQIKQADPDFIIIAPCGFSMERTQQEMHLFTGHPVWNELKAVQGKNVFIADGNHYFNRSGPRVIDTVEILAEILQVNQFHFGMENEAWLWYNFED